MSHGLNVVDLVDVGVGRGDAEFCGHTSIASKHFRLRENPFGDSVNPNYFFRTESHEDAFIRMRKCIDEHISLGLTTAPSGTGKTLLTQILLSELDAARYEPILVLAYPGMKRLGLLREVAQEMGVELNARATLHQSMECIYNGIVSLHQTGRKLVIIIDECHFLGVEALQMVRTLSNLELPERKLVTILLFGEESFLEKMGRPEYASIFNRMFVRTHLRALSLEETQQYVKFRCLVSGGAPGLFRPDYYPRLHEVSRGIPREINRLCHNALFEAARAGAENVGPEFVLT